MLFTESPLLFHKCNCENTMASCIDKHDYRIERCVLSKQHNERSGLWRLPLTIRSSCFCIRLLSSVKPLQSYNLSRTEGLCLDRLLTSKPCQRTPTEFNLLLPSHTSKSTGHRLNLSSLPVPNSLNMQPNPLAIIQNLLDIVAVLC